MKSHGMLVFFLIASSTGFSGFYWSDRLSKKLGNNPGIEMIAPPPQQRCIRWHIEEDTETVRSPNGLRFGGIGGVPLAGGMRIGGVGGAPFSSRTAKRESTVCDEYETIGDSE